MLIDVLPTRASVRPFLVHTAPRWRLRLRAWWLQRRGQALLKPVGGRTVAALDFSLQHPRGKDTPQAGTERGLLELNLMFERARLQRSAVIRQIQP